MQPAALDHLVRDHVRLGRIIDLMERELHSGVPGGLALMREAFDYMRCYLDEHQ